MRRKVFSSLAATVFGNPGNSNPVAAGPEILPHLFLTKNYTLTLVETYLLLINLVTRYSPVWAGTWLEQGITGGT